MALKHTKSFRFPSKRKSNQVPNEREGETYGNRIGRVDDKVTQGKSESGAGTLDRDAVRTTDIAAITSTYT